MPDDLRTVGAAQDEDPLTVGATQPDGPLTLDATQPEDPLTLDATQHDGPVDGEAVEQCPQPGGEPSGSTGRNAPRETPSASSTTRSYCQVAVPGTLDGRRRVAGVGVVGAGAGKREAGSGK